MKCTQYKRHTPTSVPKILPICGVPCVATTVHNITQILSVPHQFVQAVEELGTEYLNLPASWDRHSSCEFGLLYHSVNCATQMLQLLPERLSQFTPYAFLLGLLHDAKKLSLFATYCTGCDTPFVSAVESMQSFAAKHSECKSHLLVKHIFRPVLDAGVILVYRNRALGSQNDFLSFLLDPTQMEANQEIFAILRRVDAACSDDEPKSPCSIYMGMKCGLCSAD